MRLAVMLIVPAIVMGAIAGVVIGSIFVLGKLLVTKYAAQICMVVLPTYNVVDPATGEALACMLGYAVLIILATACIVFLITMRLKGWLQPCIIAILFSFLVGGSMRLVMTIPEYEKNLRNAIRGETPKLSKPLQAGTDFQAFTTGGEYGIFVISKAKAEELGWIMPEPVVITTTEQARVQVEKFEPAKEVTPLPKEE